MSEDGPRVDLAGSESATAHLHAALVAAATSFPSVFADVDVAPTADRFKKSYPDVLPRFEAARADADARAEIAALLATAARTAVVWHGDDGEQPLADHVTSAAAPFELETAALPGAGRLRPRVPFDGVDRSGAELVAVVGALVERGSATPQVADAIEWIVARGGENGGVDLGDRRIVVLGAAAELAPTKMWLEGGADVLWIDVAPPPAELLGADDLSGTVRWVEGGSDLLTDPARIRATIEAFADGNPVDVGLYAYAPGRAREWRLSAAMNAIVDALPAGTVRGVAMLLSPTTCGVLTADDLAGEKRRREERPRWLAVLDRLGLLGRGDGHARHGATCANRGIVPIQGGSYQAAQYLGKMMAAEAWATGERPFPVSANTAGISLTDSLHHPVFDTAFSGAAALGVETFEPRTTRWLNGLLTLRDRLDPTDDGLFDTRVHGGTYQIPYPIEPALRVATALGVTKDPRRLPALIRG